MAEEKEGMNKLLLLGVPLVAAGSVVILLVLLLATGHSAAACAGDAATVDPDVIPATPVAGYSGEQLRNAALIMNAANTLSLGRDAQVLGLMAAMGESGLTNIDYGDDRDGATNPDGTPTCSLGLFQQQWCLGSWGTRDQVLDPTHAATTFFQHLAQVPAWESLEPTIAIHKVQRNADPYHYEKYAGPADSVVTALAGDAATGGGCTGGNVVLPLAPGFAMTADYGPRPQPIAGASTWHPADDLQHSATPCKDPIYSITTGTVALIDGYQVSIKSPDGYTVTYMHMKLSDVSVQVGDPVTPGEQIALTGNEGPSTGCHLDIRINKQGTTNPAVSALTAGEDLGGPPASHGFVNPEEFFSLFGVNLCPPDSCQRTY